MHSMLNPRVRHRDTETDQDRLGLDVVVQRSLTKLTANAALLITSEDYTSPKRQSNEASVQRPRQAAQLGRR
ncbi:hypothetical protein HBI56_133550 [Parastagonospora nodorum]|nr:hypothetical protein HBH53_047300 [Parastagonospora nodorum]KAH4201292.1 hypothetical protein HBH42_027630 [Parastagonospora nodorum]KAH4300586.1 hypothetical protein HBI02_151100 [Parastagonospora nodorum]KAH4306864.1 hypothetical protein HBI01_053800 [Parastagonospora nodorum]KAH4337087.1 hypothetical protein HBI00_017440 [Parastagonospora nodorum]